MPDEFDDTAPQPQYPWGRGWDWINKGTEMFLASPGIWVLLLTLQLVIGIGISMTPTPEGLTGVAIEVVLEMIGLVVSVLFDAGLLLGCQSMRNGEPLRVGTLFAAFRHPAALNLIKLALIQILVWIAVGTLAMCLVAVMLIGPNSLSGMEASGVLDVILGSLGTALIIVLFVTTLVLLFVMALWMAAPLVLFRGLSPSRALVVSFNANFRNVRALTVYGLGMAALALVAALPLLLGFFVWLPLATTTRYAAFLDLFAAPPGVTQAVRAL